MFLVARLQERILLGKAICSISGTFWDRRHVNKLTCPSGEKTVRAKGTLSAMFLSLELDRMPEGDVALFPAWPLLTSVVRARHYE